MIWDVNRVIDLVDIFFAIRQPGTHLMRELSAHRYKGVDQRRVMTSDMEVIGVVRMHPRDHAGHVRVGLHDFPNHAVAISRDTGSYDSWRTVCGTNSLDRPGINRG